MIQDEPRMLSELQHFSICPRQWALIHIEQQWAENIHTTEGNLFHHRAHDEKAFESRGDLLIARGLRVFSRRLNVVGVCDVVEFHSSPNGIEIFGRPGTWTVVPVEYKKGHTKLNDADRLQLCGQALCLEEMLQTHIDEGFLFYGQARRREQVLFDEALRRKVEAMLQTMRAYAERGYTPPARPIRACDGCSLGDVCLPTLSRHESVARYLKRHLDQEDP